MYKPDTYKEQEDAIQKFSHLIEQGTVQGGIAWFDMGQGKTRIAVETWRRSKLQFMFVATKRAAFDAWLEEIEKCKVHCISSEISDVMDLSYNFTHSFVGLQTVDSLHHLPENFPFHRTLLVLDELYLYGNHITKRSVRAFRLSNQCCFTLGLSATMMPAHNNETIYGQSKAVGIHSSLAPTMTEFRNRYRRNIFSPFVKSGQWENKQGSTKEIVERLSSFVAVHFPDKKHRNIRSQIIRVKPSNDQSKAIRDLQETWSIHGEVFKHTLSIARKIQAISNGWTTDPEDEGSLFCYDCSKLDRLLTLVDELVAAEKKCVIWCAFRNDVEYLTMHIKHPTLPFVGQQKFDSDKWKSGKYPVILATVANGSSVNHFGDAEFGIYYSLSSKWLELQQSQGRHERKNSTHAGAFYYYLLTSNTLDEHIYNTVMESKDVESVALAAAIDVLLKTNTNT